VGLILKAGGNECMDRLEFEAISISRCIIGRGVWVLMNDTWCDLYIAGYTVPMIECVPGLGLGHNLYTLLIAHATIWVLNTC
jgi:hypothetical protein